MSNEALAPAPVVGYEEASPAPVGYEEASLIWERDLAAWQQETHARDDIQEEEPHGAGAVS